MEYIRLVWISMQWRWKKTYTRDVHLKRGVDVQFQFQRCFFKRQSAFVCLHEGITIGNLYCFLNGGEALKIITIFKDASQQWINNKTSSIYSSKDIAPFFIFFPQRTAVKEVRGSLAVAIHSPSSSIKT